MLAGRCLHLAPRLPVAISIHRPPPTRPPSTPPPPFNSYSSSSAAAAAAAAAASPQLPYWPGLDTWRDASLNEHRSWGPQGPSEPDSTINDDHPSPSPSSLAEYGTLVLSTADPLAKSRLSHLAFSQWRHRRLPIGAAQPPDRPARPATPLLVSPKELPSHKHLGLPRNVYMLHSLAHVELNAIDLAWDTVVRFSPLRDVLGDEFFSDFARVADDESRHFTWCSQRLAELGFSYGDMPAHNLLWRECEKSSGDVAARLAMIPLVQVVPCKERRLYFFGHFDLRSQKKLNIRIGHQEARGLDAGPRLVQKLVGFGDRRTSNIVAKIAEEEVAHVAVGVFWFAKVCERMGRIPCATFKDMLKEYNVEVKGPFNLSARDEAGIPRVTGMMVHLRRRIRVSFLRSMIGSLALLPWRERTQA